MQEYALKLIRAANAVRAARGYSASPEVRLGIWPIVSAQQPALAMGVANALALLLDRWSTLVIYRVFSRLDVPDESPYARARTQFTVDDWVFDGLNDDAGLWGTLESESQGWTLTLELESNDEEGIQTFTASNANVAGLISDLPQLACAIAEALGVGVGGDKRELPAEAENSDHLRETLIAAFEFETVLQQAVFELGNQVTAAQRVLISAASAGDAFCGWIAALMSERGVQLGEKISEHLLPAASVAESLKGSAPAQIVMGRVLYAGGQRSQAVAVIEKALAEDDQLADGWMILASIFSQAGRVKDTVSVLQTSIENGSADARTFVSYAALLNVIDGQGLKVDSVVLVDPAVYPRHVTAREAAAAYAEAVEREPEDLALQLSSWAQSLITLEDLESFWPVFNRLVDVDTDGGYVRAVIEDMHSLDDVRLGIQHIRALLTQESTPERQVSLALLYLISGKEEDALNTLESAREVTDNPLLIAEIDRLWLIAQDPEIEAFIGECIDRLSSGAPLDEETVEELEDIIASAPHYGEAYILLARAYLAWKDSGAALEVLLDAQKHLPHDADVLELLGRTLWSTGQRDLALQYLQQGLVHHPDNVGLLVRVGQCLLELEDVEGARDYISRAELIEPQHPALRAARLKIAELLSR